MSLCNSNPHKYILKKIELKNVKNIKCFDILTEYWYLKLAGYGKRTVKNLS